VTLRPPAYTFDPDELRRAINPKTKLLLVNTPHNPTGKVLDQTELQLVAELAIEHDLIVITDEVYEHLTFDGVGHVPLATLSGMRERTLVISSGGKTFNTTGWKIGWICGPPELVTAARTAKQFLTYVNGGPFQMGIATGLGLADAFFTELAADLQSKRDRLVPGLVEAGFDVYPTKGTYFVTVDVRPLRPDGDGMAFCRDLAHRCGVVAIPNEVFYANKQEGRHLVRFAFSKRLDVLDEAAARLKTLSA
jgi:N-succinyldiaminopimelate aminotransferase